MPQLEPKLKAAIVAISGRSAGSGIEWLVGGSVGAILHGVQLDAPPRDLDIDTTGPGAYSLEARLSEYVQEAVTLSETPLYRNYFGCLKIDGVEVDLVGDLDVKHKSFAHHFRITPEVWHKRTVVDVGGFEVGLTPLEHQLILNLIRGREDRTRPIAGYLRRHGPDWEYLEQVFAADNAPADFRRRVMDLLL